MDHHLQPSVMPQRERNYGIDLLRILCMYSIVLLHVLGQGCVGQNVAQFSKAYYGYLFLRFLSEYAVNALCMISGFVMYRSRPKLSRLLSLWTHVLFYSVVISALFILFNRPVIPSIRREFYSMLLPITSSRYWYLSCYFCMFFLIPVLNAGIEKLSGKEMRSMLISLFILVCVLGSFNTNRKDPFSMDYGYTVSWLCILYLAGGACAKYDIPSRLRAWQCLLGVAACIASSILFKHWMDVNRWRLSYTLDWMVMSNVSVTYTLEAFFLLNLFARIRPGEKLRRVISLLAPVSLGVYLIHVHPQVWDHLITERFAPLANLPWLLMMLAAAGSAFIIFAFCLAVDLCRQRLFRLLRIDKACSVVGDFLDRLAR